MGPPYVITVEAAIGCGKSTFLKLLADHYKMQVKVVYEPVEAWQCVTTTKKEKNTLKVQRSKPVEAKITSLEPVSETSDVNTDSSLNLDQDGLDTEIESKAAAEEGTSNTVPVSEPIMSAAVSAATTEPDIMVSKTTADYASQTTPQIAPEASVPELGLPPPEPSSPSKPAKCPRGLKKTSSELFIDEGNGNFNALDLFYKHPRKFSYAFQGYVFITRVQQIEETINELRDADKLDSTLIVIERSWLTDSETFVKLLKEGNSISEIEYRMYQNWHSWLAEKAPPIRACVYLRANCDTVMSRLKIRDRSEEGGLSREYQEGLIKKHDDLLLEKDVKIRNTLPLDRTISRGNNEFGEATLIIDAGQDFQHNEDRLMEIFKKLENFLTNTGTGPKNFGNGNKKKNLLRRLNSEPDSEKKADEPEGEWLCTLESKEGDMICSIYDKDGSIIVEKSGNVKATITATSNKRVCVKDQTYDSPGKRRKMHEQGIMGTFVPN